jgi:serine/threonine-protein kinase
MLKPGTRLGPYEILSQLGAGGMGEVYKGRDVRLDRLVALKLLAPHLAGNPEARERFEREATTVANLKHAHICLLYDIGKDGGRDFLVLEYLEGETLAQRLAKGPLPLDQVLRYAIEISDALDKAHCTGVTHRDIKPGNIMLVPQGEKGSKIATKLLDFGLAKLKQDTALAKLPRSEWPTGMGAPTVLGTVLGTPHYMAPEQAEGKVDQLDARSDIFAFGTVIHEMATGKKAFEGQSQASISAAILKEDPPPLSSLEPPGKLSSPALDHLVKTCLAKDPDERWQTARDITKQLKWIAEAGSQASASAAAIAPARPHRRWILAAGLACVIAAAIAGIAAWTLKLSPPQPVTRSVITLPPGDRLAPAEQRALALSPDGKLLAYVAIHDAVQQLYLRAMDGFEAKAVPGTEGATAPFFSPDSQWIGFIAGGSLKKVSASGGAAVTIGEAPGAFGQGASWGDNDIIAFQSTTLGGLSQISAAGGAAQQLTTLDKGEGTHRWPEFLPDGNTLLFGASPNNAIWNNAQVAAYSLGTGERRNLVQGVSPRYAPTGRLIYAQAGTLMAAPFDAKRLEVTGPPVPVVEGVLQSPIAGNAQYAFSAATGALVFVPGGVQGSQSRLVWVNHNGMEQPLPAPARAYLYLRLSPDGKRMVARVSEQESHLWTYDLARDTLTRLTFEGNVNSTSAWTPDGKRIAFNSDRAGPLNLFWQLADGSGGIERLTTSEYPNSPTSFSPDGQLLAYTEQHSATGYDIWVLRLGNPGQPAPATRGAGDESRKGEPFLRTQFNESAPKFSPDGRWLAYASDESGRWEIYVQPYPGPGGKWQISTEGGTEPVWNPNGRELFYRSGDKMMAVDVTTQPGFSAGRPRMLFEAGMYLPTPATHQNYDVSPDGQRFLMLKPGEQQGQAATQINVVLNWFEELKRRVPTN